MFYAFAILFPLLILAALYYKRKPRLKVFSEYVDFAYRALPLGFVYALILYYLETEDLVDSGYAFLSLITFLIPLAIIVLALKSYYWFRQRR
jgi:branched-subunit amino acid transport protein AzlD